MHLRVLAKHTALAVLISFATSPVLAANSANSMSVKVGYFNLALVKASFPESAGSEVLRTQAESQLRRDVELGNSRLQKSQEEKKPKEEIEKMAQQLQVEINAKQRALIELVQNQTQSANQQIAAAVAQVARDKGLDMVVDGAGVYAGGDKIVSSGEDITDSVVKRLSPMAAKSSPAPSAAPAPSTTPAQKK
jgi:Skp family chaperone for outer membrane proteins